MSKLSLIRTGARFALARSWRSSWCRPIRGARRSRTASAVAPTLRLRCDPFNEVAAGVRPPGALVRCSEEEARRVFDRVCLGHPPMRG
jgi:hypothetical protein